jgi:hypothetical protein
MVSLPHHVDLKQNNEEKQHSACKDSQSIGQQIAYDQTCPSIAHSHHSKEKDYQAIKPEVSFYTGEALVKTGNQEQEKEQGRERKPCIQDQKLMQGYIVQGLLPLCSGLKSRFGG